MDLKKVNRIPQKCEDIVHGYIKEVQCILPPENSYYNIVSLITHSILLYFHNFIESNLFTDDEIDELFNLLLSNDKQIANNPWRLLFSSEEHGVERRKFVKKVHEEQNVILIIKLKGKAIIGGYTKTGWNKMQGDISLKSTQNDEPFISNVKQDEKSISHALANHSDSYGIFGARWIFYINNQHLHFQAHHLYADSANYQAFKHGKDYLYQEPSSEADAVLRYTPDEFQFEVFQMEV